jgi:predicted dienelactone hydrolase
MSIALPLLLPVFHFKKPTGPYAIGTLTYHWVDANRPELFTADPSDHRELMAQVWYPAPAHPGAKQAPYVADANAVMPALARLLHNLPGFTFSHFRYVTTNATNAAPIADDQANYPVLIFLTGLDGFRSSNTFQVEELVSHGYIVVGLDQPGAAAMVRLPDGRQIPGWPKGKIQPLIDQSITPHTPAPMLSKQSLPNGIIPYFTQDISFALDQLATINQADPQHILTDHLDLSRVGAFGISLGGMEAAEACQKDPRLGACLIMDVWMPQDVAQSGFSQPGMFITRDANSMRLEGWTERDSRLTRDTMRTAYQKLSGAGYYVEIPNTFHLNFTDAPYWSPMTSQLGLTGLINGQRGFAIINAYSLAFFDKHLKHQPSPLLNGPSQTYPEVRLESH